MNPKQTNTSDKSDTSKKVDKSEAQARQQKPQLII
jgi:hypothetical protein